MYVCGVPKLFTQIYQKEMSAVTQLDYHFKAYSFKVRKLFIGYKLVGFFTTISRCVKTHSNVKHVATNVVQKFEPSLYLACPRRASEYTGKKS